ncbi:MAG TPA: PilZ domain-containing protein [Polyangia bacterium]
MTKAHVRRDMRKHSRRTVELPVVVSDAANKVKAGIRFGAADVSLGGAFLCSDLLFEIGEVLNLTIQLPDSRQILARGRVVRVSRGATDEQPPGMGIEFVDLSPVDRAAVEAALV